MMKKYEVIVDLFESNVLTIEARDEDDAKDIAEIDGWSLHEGDPHHVEVKVFCIKEVNDE